MKRRSSANRQTINLEVELGKFLFEKRARRSEISGDFLGHDYNHAFCSHLLTKAAYPKFRLYSKNLVLKTFEEHRSWELWPHKLKKLPEWEWVFKLHELLKQEYYQRKDIFFDPFGVIITRLK